MNLRIFFYFALISVALVSCGGGKGDYVVVRGYAQGGEYSVKFNAEGITETPERIREEIDSILLAIDNSVSGHNKGSILSRLNAGEPVVPDEIFERMYFAACRFYDEYDGLVDAASGELFDLWGFGFKAGEFPDSAVVEAVLSSCGMDRLKRPDALAALLRPDGKLYPGDLPVGGGKMPVLNFNAFAQGMSADMVAEHLHSLGVKDMLVDIGEIFREGCNPAGRPWAVGVDAPFDGNNTPGANIQAVHHCPSEGGGLVTSGNYRKFYVRDGKKYSHTIDPRTGYPVQHNLLSATVEAPSSAEADAAATCCMVLGVEGAKILIESKGYEALLLYDEGGEIRAWHSDGFEVTSN